MLWHTSLHVTHGCADADNNGVSGGSQMVTPAFILLSVSLLSERTGGIAARYHVGDTPMDLQAADQAGARGVGVTTGIFSREELAEASPGERQALHHVVHAHADCAQTPCESGVCMVCGRSQVAGRYSACSCVVQSRSSCRTWRTSTWCCALSGCSNDVDS